MTDKNKKITALSDDDLNGVSGGASIDGSLSSEEMATFNYLCNKYGFIPSGSIEFDIRELTCVIIYSKVSLNLDADSDLKLLNNIKNYNSNNIPDGNVNVNDFGVEIEKLIGPG